MILRYPQILSLLPHAHPMVLVDLVVSLRPGESAEGIKAVTGSEPCYHGLRGGLSLERYAYPGPLLLESFGQTAALLWLVSTRANEKDPESIIMLAAARDCRLEGRAYPGDVLRHKARLDRVIGDHAFVSGETWIEDRRVAMVGEMIAVRRPKSVVIALGKSSRQTGAVGG